MTKFRLESKVFQSYLNTATMGSLSSTGSSCASALRSAVRSGARSYAVPSFAPSAASPFSVFDRNLKVAQRDRAARNKERSRLTDYVKDDVAQSMVDRLLVSRRSDGPVALPISFGLTSTDTRRILNGGIQSYSTSGPARVSCRSTSTRRLRRK